MANLPPLHRSTFILCVLLFALLTSAPAYAVTSGQNLREMILLDPSWRFALGDASSMKGDFGYGSGWLFAKAGQGEGPVAVEFNDSSWRCVDLPHDWAVELEFVKSDEWPVESHGYKPVGRTFPLTTIGWYRKSFPLPESDRGRRFELRFDGVFRNCNVWLNGHYLGNNLSGYSAFGYDITDYVQYGKKNVLVVRADASQNEGWFYEGAGIYRHAWLIKHAPTHIPEHGTFVWTDLAGKAGTVHVSTVIRNDNVSATRCGLALSVLDAQGTVVASAEATSRSVGAFTSDSLLQHLTISQPRLWDLDHPYLYQLVSEVNIGGNVVDRTMTSFGIRSIRFDKDKGFYLNGKRVELLGVCCHQDHAGVGAALPDRLQSYRIERLKEMGVNAYRTSHNPPTPELLDACDRLGMLVMDENRLLGSSPELMSQFERLVLRDRNHPSVILWSLGNEEWVVQDTEPAKNIALSLMRRMKELDPTRTCTYAANNGNQFEGINSVMPVRGFNYFSVMDIDKYRRDHPDQILLGSEEASTVCTRGIFANDTVRGYVSDYDVNATSWGATAERWWKFYAEREWLAGAFVWTGFDYRGEPTPYKWPCINSHFGIMDVCGFPKNNFYYYQAWWTQKDVLHLAPHWNWQGQEGKTIDIWCQSNCDSVELRSNGKSLGRKTMERNGHLEWKVAYAPGKIEARGWKGGRILTTFIETTGNATTLRLTPDRRAITADGEDLCMITVTTTDARGREVPVSDNLVRFALTGNGRILGVGNGDPSSHEPDKCAEGEWQRRLFNGRCQIIVQAGRNPGTLQLRALSDGLQPAEIGVGMLAGAVRPFVE